MKQIYNLARKFSSNQRNIEYWSFMYNLSRILNFEVFHRIVRDWKACIKKNLEFCLAFNTPGHPWVSTKKCQAIRSNRLVGYREDIYECLVLSYRLYIQDFLVKYCIFFYWIFNILNINYFILNIDTWK